MRQSTREDWHLLIRRAYNVPDVVGDKAAVEHIVFSLAQAVGEEDQHALDTLPGRFLEATEQMAESGELDGYFVDVRLFDTEDLAVKLAKQAEADSEVVLTMLSDLLEHLKAFLDHYPFLDSSGAPIAKL